MGNVIPVGLLTEESVLSSLQIREFYFRFALLIFSCERGRVEACKKRLRKDITGKIAEMPPQQGLAEAIGPNPHSGVVGFAADHTERLLDSKTSMFSSHPSMPNPRLSLKCSVPTVLNSKVFLQLPNHKVPPVPKPLVSLQHLTPECPCSARPLGVSE